MAKILNQNKNTCAVYAINRNIQLSQKKITGKNSQLKAEQPPPKWTGNLKKDPTPEDKEEATSRGRRGDFAI